MAEVLRLLDQVLERDLDIALLSGLFASEPFRAFVIHRVVGWTAKHDFIGVRVSETTDAGETDVLLVVDLGVTGRLAILIEDKIGALFQPAQSERYRERGARGIREGRWHRCATCLCAPEGYLAVTRAAGEWDAYVALEDIAEWARLSGDQHMLFVAAICNQAVAKREARMREVSPEASAFWRAYRQLAAELLPEIDIARLPDSVSANQPWPQFGASLLPPGMYVEHKASQGCIDLTFNAVALDALRNWLPSGISFDIVPKRAGASSALRLAVPRIDHFRPFDEQQEEVLAAFAAAERMLILGRELAIRDGRPVSPPRR